MDKVLVKILQDIAEKYKIPSPFWTDFVLEEKPDGIEATVYVSVSLLPNPMFLTDISFATTLQKLITNPVATTEAGKDINVFFAVEGNGTKKEETLKKLGQDSSESQLDFYMKMQEQGIKKLESYISQLPADAALAYWTIRGLTAIINHAMEAGVPRREELPGGLVVYQKKRKKERRR